MEIGWIDFGWWLAIMRRLGGLLEIFLGYDFVGSYWVGLGVILVYLVITLLIKFGGWGMLESVDELRQTGVCMGTTKMDWAQQQIQAG